MSSPNPGPIPNPLITSLHTSLTHISAHPPPHIINPPSCPRRASVALVIRIRPSSQHAPSAHPLHPPTSLSQFFALPWVSHGTPEVLFIKRAAREGDRWTSHVALPGGKRDPEDESDRATAIRETMEEVGLDIGGADGGECLFVGGLRERVVKTNWGTVPIMVLSPFVFLHTSPTSPPLVLQPTEVASTHWVPLHILLSPSVRTYEYVDVSSRYSFVSYVPKLIVRSLLGEMRFSAVRLIPSESLYTSEAKEFFAESDSALTASFPRLAYEWITGYELKQKEHKGDLLLWGLTLGMLADFLDMLPPHNAVQLWDYPTFTSPDVRLIVNILTSGLKRRNRGKLGRNQTAVDSETAAVDIGGPEASQNGADENPPSRDTGEDSKADDEEGYAVGIMLDGYYALMARGVKLAAGFRLLGFLGLLVWVVGTLRKVKLGSLRRRW